MHFSEVKILKKVIHSIVKSFLKITFKTRTRNNTSRFVIVVNVVSLYSKGNFESRLMKRRLCLLICGSSEFFKSGFLGKTSVASTRTVARIRSSRSTPASSLSWLAEKKKKTNRKSKGVFCDQAFGISKAIKSIYHLPGKPSLNSRAVFRVIYIKVA